MAKPFIYGNYQIYQLITVCPQMMGTHLLEFQLKVCPSFMDIRYCMQLKRKMCLTLGNCDNKYMIMAIQFIQIKST